MKLLVLTALAGAAMAALTPGALASDAPALGRDPNACFFVRDVGDRVVTGPHTLYFKVKDRAHMHTVAIYHVETAGECDAGLGSSTDHGGFTVVPRDRTMPAYAWQICGVQDLQINTRAPCVVASMTLATPTEIAALPRTLQP